MKKLMVLTQIAGILCVFPVALAQETSVDCPGARDLVLCNENQVAICWTSESDTSKRCLTPPEGVTGLSLDLWLLSYLLDDTLTVTDQRIESYRAIIRRGKWEGNTHKVAFALPNDWKGTR